MYYITQVLYLQKNIIMSLKYAVLGFLNDTKLSGYDLQKKINNTINHFWPSTQSQIYRTLNELVEGGLTEMQIIYQDDKPNKKIYSITEKGKKNLEVWLNTKIGLPNHRNQFLVQLFFSTNLDNKNIIENLLYYKEIMISRLKFLENELLNIQGININKKQKIYALIAENGIWALKNEINWIEYAINTIYNEE